MRAACLTELKKSQLPKKAVFSVLLLIKNQQYFIFKKINSSCQLLARYTHIKTFYRSLLNLQKGLHSLVHLYGSASLALDAVLEGN